MKRSLAALLTLMLALSSAVPLASQGPSDGPWYCALPLIAASFSSDPPTPTATFSLDGVDLELSTTFLSDLEFSTSDPNTAIQVATAVERDPLFKELSVTAVAFGMTPPTESLPVAAPNGDDAYRARLREYRDAQEGDPTDAPPINLFGEDVIGLRSRVDIHVRGELPTPVVITEWVAEAGNRIWIVRASQELTRSSVVRPSSAYPHDVFPDTALWSDALDQPSTSLAAMAHHLPPTDLDGRVQASSVESDLPFPSWWDGECDTNNFYLATGTQAYSLGTEYRGMHACGPRPWYDGGPQILVDFGVGAWQYEWQCPELSKRFLYLAYDIAPYSANGNQVVWNYSGDLLEKVSNCTPGRAAVPDDVLSYGSTSTYGHTSVVIASDVDGNGDGTIDVIEQNSSSTGRSRIAVNNWCVEPSYTDVSGWLHEPDEDQWSVTYYSDEQLTTTCHEARYEGSYLFASWGDGAPGGSCPSDHFSARFSRWIDLAAGDYEFWLGYDDGARLKIDGEVVIDGWEGAGQFSASRYLDAGYHKLEVEYRESVGDAYLSAFWRGPGFYLTREAQDTSQWYAQYWGNQALGGAPVIMDNEGTSFLDHDWGPGAPRTILPADRFSSRFERSVQFDAGRWRFVVASDDGVRLWLDGEPILDEWKDQVAHFTSEVDLTEGTHELKLDHYENGGYAFIRLSWERVSSTATLTGGITSPIDSTTVVTCPLTIEANVGPTTGDDDGSVGPAALYAAYDDGWHHLGDDDAPPYEWTWDCSPVDNQGVWLSLHATDTSSDEVVDLGGHVYVRLRVPRYAYLPMVIQGD